MSLEVGLIVLAIGAIIGVYIVWKLVGEYRERKAEREDSSAESDSANLENDKTRNDQTGGEES
jgi:F0F1-type ATP synthase assembly protein I